MASTKNFNFKKRVTSMIRVDFRRMFTTSLYYIILGISFIVPILILVMTSMMDGQVSVNPNTGKETIITGFDNVWQTLGSTSNTSMDLVSMCNINLIFFAIALLVCLFIASDFRSGYSKNLFTIRANKIDYIFSKTLIGFLCGASLILTYFIGSLLGGKIAGISFALENFTSYNIIMCLLSKMILVLVFVPIFVLMSCIGKSKTWLSIIGSLAFSMILFTMIPMITPLTSTLINVILSLIIGLLLSIGLGSISNIVLNKTSLL